MKFLFPSRLVFVLGLAVLTQACPSGGGGGGNPDPDGGMWPDGGPPIGWVPNTPGPTVTTCEGDGQTPPATGTCTATEGSAAILITADILTPGEVFRGGQVLVAEDGTIACAACDCSAATGAAGATTLLCPDAVLSPGLINAHDHITFVRNDPYDRTEERYEHRHDWRRGVRGHENVGASGMSSNAQMAWGELRFVMGGATSINGSGSSSGLLRNVDKENDAAPIAQKSVYYETFPLDDSDGTLRASGCGYGEDMQLSSDIANDDAYTPHIAEGIDAEARNEFLCLREGEHDVIAPQTALIHGTGLLAPDIAEISLEGSSLVWSPRTNVTLYGDTARVPVYATLGVNIALGTDWISTGSMNVLRELTCADELNALYFNGYFNDEQLWLMATKNSADALGIGDVLGEIREGAIADLALFRTNGRVDHRAIIEAEAADVALVLRAGKVLYGDANAVDALGGAASCDAIDVCGDPKKACVSDEVGQSLASLEAAVAGTYPLFFCETPDNEPSCVPARNADDPYPAPERNGSNRYTGEISDTDGDGDGILDGEDNCVASFNPIRPVDNGAQADFDGDGLGDECDPCPMQPGTLECTALDPDDRDGDGVANAADNCPLAPNPEQENADNDPFGDACDQCPEDVNGDGAGCPSSIYEIQNGTVTLGSAVTIDDVVVSALGTAGFFVQTPTNSADYDGAEYSGIYVYTGGAPTVTVGQLLSISLAYANEYQGQKQLGSAEFTVKGPGTVPAPEEVDSADIAPGTATALKLDGVLVEVTDVTVSSADAENPGEFELDGGAMVGNFLYAIDPAPVMGESFDRITGVLSLRKGDSQIMPRDEDDVEAGAPSIATFGPDPVFVRVSASPTQAIPEPLVVALSRASATPTEITFATGGAGLVVSSVMIPAGMTEVEVPLRGVTASTTLYSLTATLGTHSKMTNVRVISANQAAKVGALVAERASVPVNGSVEFTVTLDVPSPPGGTTVTLSSTAGGSVPASVNIPADELTATFMFTAGGADATPMITATAPLGGKSATITVTTGAEGSLVINEVDYDQSVNPDSLEFVELYNRSASTISLAGVDLVLVNGNNGTEYDRVSLSGSLAAGAYVVVGSAAVTVAGGATRFNEWSENGLQNGDPDGVFLVDTGSSTVIDALSYGGTIASWPVAGITAADVASALDDRGDGSLCRKPNGASTGSATADWMSCPTSTPGAAN
jgi:hypothetical protein